MATNDTTTDCGKKHYRKVKIGKGTHLKHRLVMEGRLGRKLDRYEVVHHKNGDIHDNRLCNLEVISLSEHSRMHATGRPMPLETVARLSGENHHNRKLDDAAVREIRSLEDGCRQTLMPVAEKFGVDVATVRKVYKGITWAHVK
jgi:hypothetical protein